MEYQELVVELAKKTRYTRRELRTILREMVLLIREAVETGRDVNFEGLGRFLNLPQKERVGRHPVTGKTMKIPATRRVRFEPCKSMKFAVRASIKIFEVEDPETKYGLTKEKKHVDGETRGRDRSQEGREGEAGRKRRTFRRPKSQRPQGSGEGD